MEEERSGTGFGLEQERSGAGFEMEEERSGRAALVLEVFFVFFRILGQSLTKYCI